MAHDCEQCFATKLCTRHPHVDKGGLAGEICSGKRDLKIREKWLRQWDEEAGIEYVPAIAELAAPKPVCCGPTVGERLINVGKAAVKWVANGLPIAPSNVIDARREICKTCELNKDGWCQHIACGCNIQAKTAVATEKCPVGKWFEHITKNRHMLPPALQPQRGNVAHVGFVQSVPVPNPFTDVPTRHLMYHIWPNRANESWKWNIDMLKAYIESFNGVRTIGIAYDNNTVSTDDVKRYFGDTRIDNWIMFKNNPRLRECVTFVPCLKTLPNGVNDITFSAHAKGVRHNSDADNITLTWAYVLYRLSLDSLELVDELLQLYPVIGSFKRYNEFRLPKHHCWHYSGSFYWFRNSEVFAQEGWCDLASGFFAGTEAWPARIFRPDQGGVIFGDDAGNLYDRAEWRKWQDSLRTQFNIEIEV